MEKLEGHPTPLLQELNTKTASTANITDPLFISRGLCKNINFTLNGAIFVLLSVFQNKIFNATWIKRVQLSTFYDFLLNIYP